MVETVLLAPPIPKTLAVVTGVDWTMTEAGFDPNEDVCRLDVPGVEKIPPAGLESPLREVTGVEAGSRDDPLKGED